MAPAPPNVNQRGDVGAFIDAVVSALGGHSTPATVRALSTWQRMEGGSTNNPDTYNFLNTKQQMPGSHGTLGSQGNAIQAYPDSNTGVQATVKTLQNGYYPAIIQAIKTGIWSPTPELAKNLKTWSGGGYTSILGAAASGGGAAQAVLPPGAPQQPAQPALPRPTPDSNTLAILNQGAKLFGLPPLPSMPSSAPTRLPTAGPVTPSPAPAPPTQPPKAKGPTLGYIEHQAAPFGLTVTSTTGGKHAEGSYHYQGRAADFGGAPDKMAALAKYALSHAGQWTEFIYTGPGNPGYSILGGRVIPNSQLDKTLFDEHTNHVHLAR